jgi:hypothetical protein
MAKTAVKAEPAAEVNYDVAISFLAADENTAGAIADVLEASGLKVFFFPKKQEDLAGSDGLDSMREPFLKARVAVALYREPWGKTKWTRVEESAIKDRCLDIGWESLQFVMLDKQQSHPRWLPNTHIRYNYEDYGLDQLVGAIKREVQKHGGVIAPLNAMDHAKRVKHEADYISDRDRLMRDRNWIEQAIHQSLRDIFKNVAELVALANKEHGFQIEIGSQDYQTCILRSGHVSLGIGWRQPIFNSVMSDQQGECYLRACEVSGTLPIPGRNEMSWQKPQVIKEHRFKPDVSSSRELEWVLGRERIAPNKLADRIVTIMLDLIGRMNAGKVPRPPL